MATYIVVLRHDNGTIKIQTNAKDTATAINKVLAAEMAPESAIESIVRID